MSHVVLLAYLTLFTIFHGKHVVRARLTVPIRCPTAVPLQFHNFNPKLILNCPLPVFLANSIPQPGSFPVLCQFQRLRSKRPDFPINTGLDGAVTSPIHPHNTTTAMASTFPADFIEARTLFEKLASNAKLLKEYDAPAQKRIMQLQEVGQAAV
jgi:hypothetical protein